MSGKLGSWLTPRRIGIVVSLGLIAAGLFRTFVEVRSPDRPVGTVDEIAGLSERDDLNLVFILIDTLRADRLSGYGYDRPTSPIIDALAESGIRFADTNAQSTWTKASMASLWTASYPKTTGVTRYSHGLPDQVRSPTEILKDAGYRTVGIFRNGWVSPNFGFAQGFDLYFKPQVMKLPTDRIHKNPSATKLPGTDHDVAQAVGQFLQSAGDERFFLYLHLMDVHQYVYDDSVDFGAGFSDIYDASIRWVDANVGTIVAMLQNEKLMRRTVLVIASDHGEAFYEHGEEGHARTLYRETTNVPWIVALPFRLPEPVVVETPVENVDIWPTLLDLMGNEPLKEAQGVSQVPMILAAARGEEQTVAVADRPRFSHLDKNWGQAKRDPNPLIAVESGGYRLFHLPNDPDADEIYDIVNDRAEQKNLSSEQGDEVEQLHARLEGYQSLPAPSWGKPTFVALDEMRLNQLRALGYAIDTTEELPATDGPTWAQGPETGESPEAVVD